MLTILGSPPKRRCQRSELRTTTLSPPGWSSRGVSSRPAIGWGQLSLGNLGAAVLQWLGAARGGDRFTGVAVLCGIFVVVGVLKGVADFWNYMLAL